MVFVLYFLRSILPFRGLSVCLSVMFMHCEIWQPTADHVSLLFEQRNYRRIESILIDSRVLIIVTLSLVLFGIVEAQWCSG